MALPKILLQLDTDPQPSSFDAIVALDAGVDRLLSYAWVEPEQAREIAYGAMFTRGPDDLRFTAIFIGGSDREMAEIVWEQIQKAFFGPMRVSVMLDVSGANTTAVAAVMAARRHLDLTTTRALVLGSTGPVGQRVVELLARHGAHVRAGSRSLQRAIDVVQYVAQRIETEQVEPVVTASASERKEALEGVDVVVAAGSSGVALLPKRDRRAADRLKLAIDLNAVPPLGIEGLEVTDRAEQRGEVLCYGAIGVGGLKMKVHKACIERLFDRNDQVLDAPEIMEIAVQSIG